MELAAIQLARTVQFSELNDLDPRGKVRLVDVVPALVKHYGFQKYPQKFDDLDDAKGIEFIDGRSNGKNITKLVIYNAALVVETRSSTADSEEVLDELLSWGSSQFGIEPQPKSLSRPARQRAYVSSLTFYSEAPILRYMSPPLDRLSGAVSEAVSEIWRERIEYEPTQLALHFDTLTRKNPIASFSIQRRVDFPFDQNKYFSEAPLPTDMHLKFLASFEAEVLSERRR